MNNLWGANAEPASPAWVCTGRPRNPWARCGAGANRSGQTNHLQVNHPKARTGVKTKRPIAGELQQDLQRAGPWVARRQGCQGQYRVVAVARNEFGRSCIDKLEQLRTPC